MDPPARSARISAVKSDTISASGPVLPSPEPLESSSLLISTILQTGGPHAALASADTLTGTILWFGGFGGQITLGVAVTEAITGGVQVSFGVSLKLSNCASRKRRSVCMSTLKRTVPPAKAERSAEKPVIGIDCGTPGFVVVNRSARIASVTLSRMRTARY